MLEICKFGHLKMFVSWKVKLFCLAGLFLFNLGSNCGCEWKIIGGGILCAVVNDHNMHQRVIGPINCSF